LVWLELVRWDIKVAKNMPQNYPPAGGADMPPLYL